MVNRAGNRAMSQFALLSLEWDAVYEAAYTDFEDRMGSETDCQTKFVAKARAFLFRHLDHLRRREAEDEPAAYAVGPPRTRALARRVRRRRPRRGSSRCGRGAGTRPLRTIARGLYRAAAKSGLSGFTGVRTLTANQHEFVNLIIDP